MTSEVAFQFNGAGLGGNINTKSVDHSSILQSRPVVATNFRPMLFADNVEEFTRNTDYSNNTRSGAGMPLSTRAGQQFRDGGAGVIPLVVPWQTDDSWHAHHFTDNSRVMNKGDITAALSCASTDPTTDKGSCSAQRSYCVVRNDLSRDGVSARSGWLGANTWENRVQDFENMIKQSQSIYHRV